MARQSIRPYIDNMLGGTLDDLLRAHGRPGPSFDSLARDLAKQGIDVTSETLRRWAADLDAADIDAEAVA